MPAFNEPIVSPSDIETRFYQALAKGDIELLMACWADDDEVSCVPPGGEMLRGLAAIRQLFTDLFERGPVSVRVKDAHAANGVMHAVHTLVEEIDISADGERMIAQVYATNVYVKTPLGWRLQAHHASPGQVSPAPEAKSLVATHTLH